MMRGFLAVESDIYENVLNINDDVDDDFDCSVMLPFLALTVMSTIITNAAVIFFRVGGDPMCIYLKYALLFSALYSKMTVCKT